MNTHNTREGEEWRNSHDFKQAVFAANQFLEEPYTDPDDDVRTVARQFNRMIDRYDALKQTHHQELQKAREMWLREEIVKLEFEKLPYPYVCKSPFPGEGVDFHLKTYGHLPYFGCCKYDQLTKEETDIHNQALQTIIDRYQKELDQHK